MKYAFCPKCGHTLQTEMIEGREQLVCSSCGFVFYQHSKLCASVMVLDWGKLMLTRRGIEPYKGYWDLPGGFLEAGEHPEAGAVREIAEETGLAIRLMELFGLYMDTYGPTDEPTLNFCYLAKIIGGDPAPASDVVELGWFELDDLPDQVAFNWTQEALDQLVYRHNCPASPLFVEQALQYIRPE